LPVTGYPRVNGKTVYLDKYEITAGRMRAFIDAVTTAQGGVPDVKSYMAAHKPERWNPAWGAVLPSAYSADTGQPEVTYEIESPTPDLAYSDPLGLYGYLYPGPDIVPGSLFNINPAMATGPQTIQPGIFETFGEEDFFPEYYDSYARDHNVNCSNAAGSWGFGTYWLRPSGDIDRQFSQADMDKRALNCTTNAMFAAFCAWDGGQLVTEDVMTYVVGGTTWSPSSYGGTDLYCTDRDTGETCRIGSFFDMSSDCDGLNLKFDSAVGGACSNLDPYVESGSDKDDSGRIFPPGSIEEDVVQIVNTDEGWYDLKGNLIEMVVSDDNRFAYNGYGIGYSSTSWHRAEVVTARFKEGSAGARCMRLK